MANIKLAPPTTVFIAKIVNHLNFPNSKTTFIDYYHEDRKENSFLYSWAVKCCSNENGFEQYKYDLLVYTEDDKAYICFKPGKNYDYGVIANIPELGKILKVDKVIMAKSYNFLGRTVIKPEEIDDTFSQYGIYIIKTENKVYLCKLS